MDKTPTAGHNYDIEIPGYQRSDILSLQRQFQVENSDSWLGRFARCLKKGNDDEIIQQQNDSRAVLIDAPYLDVPDEEYPEYRGCRRFCFSNYHNLTLCTIVILLCWLLYTVFLLTKIISAFKYDKHQSPDAQHAHEYTRTNALQYVGVSLLWVVFSVIAYCVYKVMKMD